MANTRYEGNRFVMEGPGFVPPGGWGGPGGGGGWGGGFGLGGLFGGLDTPDAQSNVVQARPVVAPGLSTQQLFARMIRKKLEESMQERPEDQLGRAIASDALRDYLRRRGMAGGVGGPMIGR
jgi:hypothetical protein